MGKRGLYTTLGTAQIGEAVKTRMDILAYCDGRHSTLDIAEILGKPAWTLAPYFAELLQHDLIGPAD
jgi:aminopeptidase-like protein